MSDAQNDMLVAAKARLDELDAEHWIIEAVRMDMVGRLRADMSARNVMFTGWSHALNMSSMIYQSNDIELWGELYLLFVEVGSIIGGIDTSIDGFFKAIRFKPKFSEDWTEQRLQELYSQLTAWVAEHKDTRHSEGSNADVERSDTDESEQPAPSDPASDADAQDAASDDASGSDDAVPAKRARPQRRRRKTKKRRREDHPRVTPAQIKHVPAGDLSTNTGLHGNPVRPADMDFRVSDATAQAEADFYTDVLGADAAHIKLQVSGVHVYLAEKALAIIEDGFRARGVDYVSLGRGSAISAALIAVLGLDETGLIELSPAMRLAVDILREQRGISTDAHMADLSDYVERMTRIMADQTVAMSKLLTMSEAGAQIAALHLSDRVGVSNIPAGRDPENIDIADSGARTVLDRAVFAIEQRHEAERVKRQRSANFHRGDM